MKNKKLLIYVLLIASLFLLTSKANAAEKNEITYTLGGLGEYDTHNTTGIKTIKAFNMTENSGDKKTYNAYCMDPALSQNSAYSYRIQRQLFSSNSDKEYDNALYYILLNGYSENNKSSGSVSGNDFYIATIQAIRYITIAFNDFKVTKSNAGSANYEIFAIEHYKNTALKKVSDYNSANGSVANTVSNTAYDENKIMKSSDAIEAVIDNLFVGALNAAKSETKTGVAPLTIYNVGAVTETANGFEKDIVYLANLSDLGTDGYMKNFQLNGVGNGTTAKLEYSMDGTNYQALSSSTVLKSGQNAYIRIHAVQSKKVHNGDCEDSEYSITFDYYSSKSSNSAYILEISKNNKSAWQRFLVMSPPVGKVTGSLGMCAACESTITLPKDCTELGDEAYKDVISEISGPSNVTKCILNKSDDAGNSYKLTSNNGGVNGNNPYCQVYCKEDYATVKFSGIQTTQSGRYFKVSGKIKGTKSCYTNTASGSSVQPAYKNSINIEQYQKDMIEAQKMMIEGYDLYNKGITAKSGNIQESSNCSCGCGAKSYSLYVPYTHYFSSVTGNTVKVNKITSTVSLGSAASCPSLETMTDTNGNAMKDANGNTMTTCVNRESCISGSKDDIINEINGYISSGEALFNKGKAAYEAAITNLNNCSSSDGWENKFLFKDSESELTYSYDENFYSLVKDDIEKKSLTKKITNTSSNVWYCDKELNDENGEYSSCTGSTSYSSSSINYIVCNSNGCKTETRNISNVRYVKRTEGATAEYETPQVFYNIYASGDITTQDVLNSKLQASLIEGLPVSIKTEIGVYSFKFNLAKFGEFYDSGKLGRISGESNSVVKALKNNNTIDFEGDYICKYVTCPDCKFTCTSDDKCTICYGDDCGCTGSTCCPTCIFTTGKLKLNFNPISSSNINPTDRDLGYNWKINTSSYPLISEKAETTITEIETKGEQAYDDKPILSVKMTPALAKEIQDYNDKVMTNGGYANDTMSCYNYVDGNTTYENIFCFSDFLDEMQKNHSNLFTFIETRTSERDSSSITKSNYWTIYKNVTTYKIGTIDGVIGGPSWK